MSSLMKKSSISKHRMFPGFSLVEMMACVSIIGIIAFMAIPSVTRMRGDSERNLAIARAEALNLAQASLIQVRGRTQAALDWSGAASVEAKYTLLRPLPELFGDDARRLSALWLQRHISSVHHHHDEGRAERPERDHLLLSFLSRPDDHHHES
jgi:prepilin-type N-terminal cleavage/methylation domain-containing protein